MLRGFYPKLTITNGIVFVPHPAGGPLIELQAADVQWKLDGFPNGTLRLASKVKVFDSALFDLSILGAPGVNSTGLEILPPAARKSLAGTTAGDLTSLPLAELEKRFLHKSA